MKAFNGNSETSVSIQVRTRDKSKPCHSGLARAIWPKGTKRHTPKVVIGGIKLDNE